MSSRIFKTLAFAEGFRVATANTRAQAAEMVIPRGGMEGGAGNRHKGADQWLFVVRGRGYALVGARRFELSPGSLLLIARGKTHEIHNNRRTLLRTLNFYVPPAFTRQGNPKAAGRRK